eukprot:TRINITY_DN69377_c0_g1_i1.p1 TRINITY_DN69377_c0_g1~~TRINITY_DN69377_c0_g1_i1.p1  ORF type:complete len:283 (-),score=36.25 TRINITY_DN69377_c0_g1_i1:37-843(-)
MVASTVNDVTNHLTQCLRELFVDGFDVPSLGLYLVRNNRRFCFREQSFAAEELGSSPRDLYVFRSMQVRAVFADSETLLIKFNEMNSNHAAAVASLLRAGTLGGAFSISGTHRLVALLGQIARGKPAQRQAPEPRNTTTQQETLQPQNAPSHQGDNALQEATFWPDASTMAVVGVSAVLFAGISYCALAAGTGKVALSMVPWVPTWVSGEDSESRLDVDLDRCERTDEQQDDIGDEFQICQDHEQFCDELHVQGSERCHQDFGVTSCH